MLNWPLSIGIGILPLLFTMKLQDPFTVIKWHWVYFLATLSLFLFPRYFTLPKIKGLYPTLLVMALTSLYSVFIQNPQDWHGMLLERLSFMALFLAFFNLKDFKLIRIFNGISVTLVCSYYLCQLLGYDFLNLKFGTTPASTFGNANMLAQFLGLSFALQMSGKKTYAQLLISALCLVVSFELGCRSIVLGCLLSLPLFLYKLSPKRILFFFSSIVLCLSIYHQRPYEDVITKTTKEQRQPLQSENIRKTLWVLSWEMFKDHPMGIGVNNYEFEVVPYQVGSKLPNDENIVYQSPHNEFVRYLVEDGIIYFTCLMILLGLVIYRCHKIIPSLGILVVVGVESFFQFPLINSCGFLFISMLLAGILKHTAHPFKGNKLYFSLGVWLVLGVVGHLSYRSLGSFYLMSNYPTNKEAVKRACELMPSNWRSCLLESMAYISEGRYFDAERSVYKILDRQGSNFAAMKYAMANNFQKSLIYSGCYWAYRYDQYFENSSIASDRKEVCGKLEQHFQGMYGTIK